MSTYFPSRYGFVFAKKQVVHNVGKHIERVDCVGVSENGFYTNPTIWVNFIWQNIFCCNTYSQGAPSLAFIIADKG